MSARIVNLICPLPKARKGEHAALQLAVLFLLFFCFIGPSFCKGTHCLQRASNATSNMIALQSCFFLFFFSVTKAPTVASRWIACLHNIVSLMAVQHF